METRLLGGGVRRVLVIGGEATGKTTFARAVASYLDAPLYPLDEVAWQFADGRSDDLSGVFDPQYQAREQLIRRPLHARLARVDEIAQMPSWVAEGVFLWWTDYLFEAADAVIWLDHVGYLRAAHRIMARHARSARREVQLRRGAQKFLRFGDYRRAIAGLASVLLRTWRYHHGRAAAVPEVDDYGAVTRASTARYARAHRDKLIHVRSEADAARCLAALRMAAPAIQRGQVVRG